MVCFVELTCICCAHALPSVGSLQSSNMPWPPSSNSKRGALQYRSVCRAVYTVYVATAGVLQAIAALNKALTADPNSLEVLLSLGVSHTNELDAGKCDLTACKGIVEVPRVSTGPSIQLVSPSSSCSSRSQLVVCVFPEVASLWDW